MHRQRADERAVHRAHVLPQHAVADADRDLPGGVRSIRDVHREGSEVHVDQVMYRCKPHPYTPYCNNEAFRPGNEESSVWEEAWTKLFGCSQEPSSKPSEAPSAYPTAPPTCKQARWHPADIRRRICTNSPDYPALWDSPPLSQTYFTDSADECCRKFYDNMRCRRRDVCD